MIDLINYPIYDISGHGTPFNDSDFNAVKPLLLKHIPFHKDYCIPDWYELNIL